MPDMLVKLYELPEYQPVAEQQKGLGLKFGAQYLQRNILSWNGCATILRNVGFPNAMQPIPDSLAPALLL